jgi:hypothetical protein
VPIGYRAGATASGSAATSLTVTIPSTAQVGDVMRLGYVVFSSTADTGGQAVISAPSGGSSGAWTAFGPQQAQGHTVAKAWYKVVAAGDPGATLTCGYTVDTQAVTQKIILDVYDGIDTTNPIPVIAQATNSSASATQVMPTIDTTGHDQCWIGSLYMGRPQATATATWTPPTGWTIRQQSAPGGSASLVTCSIDNAAPVAAGPAQGGEVLTSDQPLSQNFLFTWAIAPASTVATARPNVDMTTTNWTPSQASAPMCALVADQNDTTYVASQTAPTAQVWEAKLPSMAAPPSTVVNRVQFTGGAVTGTVVTALVQGTTVIASRTDTFGGGNPAPPTTPDSLVLTLTSAQQAAITNLADLRIRCTVTAA